MACTLVSSASVGCSMSIDTPNQTAMDSSDMVLATRSSSLYLQQLMPCARLSSHGFKASLLAAGDSRLWNHVATSPVVLVRAPVAIMIAGAAWRWTAAGAVTGYGAQPCTCTGWQQWFVVRSRAFTQHDIMMGLASSLFSSREPRQSHSSTWD
jgi:hypothetical protein